MGSAEAVERTFRVHVYSKSTSFKLIDEPLVPIFRSI